VVDGSEVGKVDGSENRHVPCHFSSRRPSVSHRQPRAVE